MNLVKDEKLLKKAVQELGLESKFSTRELHLKLCRYQKGELLSGPDIKQKYLLFVVSGAAQIYGVGTEGRKIPVNLAKKGSVIGDVEFCNARNSNLFSEVVKEVLCIAIPIREDRETLEHDIRFLHYLLREISQKVYLTSVSETTAVSVEEKLLLYMREECKEHTLKGVEHATLRLQCSRRQLQRVLKGLCETGKIRRLGKGIYRLE